MESGYFRYDLEGLKFRHLPGKIGYLLQVCSFILLLLIFRMIALLFLLNLEETLPLCPFSIIFNSV